MFRWGMQPTRHTYVVHSHCALTTIDQVKCIVDTVVSVTICIRLCGSCILMHFHLPLLLLRAHRVRSQFHYFAISLLAVPTVSTRRTRRSHRIEHRIFSACGFWFYRTLGHARLAREMNTFIFHSVLVLSSSEAAAAVAAMTQHAHCTQPLAAEQNEEEEEKEQFSPHTKSNLAVARTAKLSPVHKVNEKEKKTNARSSLHSRAMRHFSLRFVLLSSFIL